MQTTDDKLIAIDVLLEPDQTMIGKANAVNARLRGNYPAGYSLDATHAPHVTLLQRFVRAKELGRGDRRDHEGPRRRTRQRNCA